MLAFAVEIRAFYEAALGLPVDSREYGIGAQILNDLGITTMRLMTNNPAKRGGLEGFGLRVTQRVPLPSKPTAENIGYLRTKVTRLGHLMDDLGSFTSSEPEPVPEGGDG